MWLPRAGTAPGASSRPSVQRQRVQAILLRAISGSPGGPTNLCLVAMRPLGRDEALQHLFVLGTSVFLIVAPIWLVVPPAAQYSLMGLGAFFALIDLIVIAALRMPRPQTS